MIAMNKQKHKNNAAVDIEKVQVGDIIDVQWSDVHSFERIRMDEIADMAEPEATRCWGAVVRKGAKYLFIASEIGDRDSDGAWVEALPYKMIEFCKVIDRVKVNDLP